PAASCSGTSWPARLAATSTPRQACLPWASQTTATPCLAMRSCAAQVCQLSGSRGRSAQPASPSLAPTRSPPSPTPPPAECSPPASASVPWLTASTRAAGCCARVYALYASSLPAQAGASSSKTARPWRLTVLSSLQALGSTTCCPTSRFPSSPPKARSCILPAYQRNPSPSVASPSSSLV